MTQMDFQVLYQYSAGKLINRRTGKVTNGAVSKDGYLRLYVQKKSVLYHRAVWTLLRGAPPKFIDHINGDKQDNRIENLRACTRTQNAGNAKLSIRNSTGYRGVSRSGKKFRALISYGGALQHLGVFSTAAQAAKEYDNAAREVFGEFASTNFS